MRSRLKRIVKQCAKLRTNFKNYSKNQLSSLDFGRKIEGIDIFWIVSPNTKLRSKYGSFVDAAKVKKKKVLRSKTGISFVRFP